MKNTRRRFEILCALVVCCFLAPPTIAPTSVALAADVIKWKCQSHLPMASTSYEGSNLAIAKLLEEKTNGRLVIEMFPAGGIVPTKDIFPAVKRGMIPIGYSTPGYWKTEIPIGQACSAGLPFAFKDLSEVMYAYRVLGLEKLQRDYIRKHHGVLYFSDHVEPNEVVSKKPINRYEDFKGLKLRSFGTQAKLFTAIGAPSTYIPGTEIYTALATGTVDGAHYGAAQGADSNKFYELCKYHLKPSSVIVPQDGWFINEKAFNELPKDIQETIVTTLNEWFYTRSLGYFVGEEKTLARVQKEMGVKICTLPDEDVKKIVKAATQVWEEAASLCPECRQAVDIVEGFLRDVGRLD
jgi:TRAP-type C4-dicarboxylate transport system substrate-binding protein